MKANSDKSKPSKKATRRVLAGVLCGASVLSLVLSLVMPPISQAIANDAQTVSTEETVMGGGSSSESTGVDSTTNGGAEKLNSDDAEGDEAGDDSQPEEQPEEEQQNEGTTTSDGETVAAVAENEQTRAAAEGIDNASELKNKLESVAENQSGSFQLMKDLDCNEEIFLNKSGSNITLDLNGCKIKYSSNNKSLFNVSNSAEFTITDSNPGVDEIAGSQLLQDQDQNLIADNCGKTAEMSYVNDVPNELTYYVTESRVNTTDSTRTNETTYKHEVKITGAIVACNSSNRVSLINLYGTNGKGGTFNLQSGVLTQEENCNVAHLIYAQSGSIVNMSGGYVCGASMGRDGAGAGIAVIDKSTLEISDGVIAGNYAPSGGGVYALNSTVNMVGGIISGNGTNDNESGYGAGICAENSMVTITKGYITNNNYQFYSDWEGSTKHLGNGCHGGGGIAAFNGGSLVISGGYITGNYSAEAGGGIYAGAWNRALSTFTFYGGTIASNVAEHSEGGGIRISAPTESVFEVSNDSHAYITNNTTNTTNDWGGGGVFVQGGSDGVQPASLRISNALITNNRAQGYGGGFAACPTGKTAITDTNGIAIFGNHDENGTRLSGGTNDKNEDQPKDKGGEITDVFTKGGHSDLFLIHKKKDNGDYIAAVTGQMLGGGAANWTGTIDNTPTSIGKYEGAQAKYMIGLKSEPTQDDKDDATAVASLFITGNSSNIHGGGIMTNGDVVAGSTTLVNVYPKMKLNGTKALTGRKLKKEEFKFQLLKQNKITKENGEISLTVPSFNKDKDGKLKLQLNGCTKVGDGVTNDGDGNFAFNLGEVYSDGSIVYYLVEDPGDRPVAGVTYDETIYKIEFKTTELKKQIVLGITYTYYSVNEVKVTKLNKQSEPIEQPNTITLSNGSDVSINITEGNTFTNTYKATGYWTPQVTKKVDGGEMKKFKFELFTKNTDNTEKTLQPNKYTSAESGKSQIVKFDKVQIGPLGIDELDSNRQAKFTYYIRECDASEADGTKHEGYKNDTKTFKVVVTATDKGDGTLICTPTYYEVDANGTERETGNPTFTNTYSTSLPLSGMSGVTLTYLAGAAVLCAAAAWMHIRRKANAKGGKRRE